MSSCSTSKSIAHDYPDTVKQFGRVGAYGGLGIGHAKTSSCTAFLIGILEVQCIVKSAYEASRDVVTSS